MFCHDRTQHEGDISIYVRDGSQAKKLRTANYHSGLARKHELLWLSLVKNGQSYILGVLYHLPRQLYIVAEFDRLYTDIIELVATHLDLVS
jgi:hypothetical protein